MPLPPLICPQAASGRAEKLTLLHRKAEDTRLPADSCDVVSMCLVAHELPQHATRAILAEAYRCVFCGFCLCVEGHSMRSGAAHCNDGT